MSNSSTTRPASLVDLTARFSDEKVCREYLTQIRWNGKPVCPYCGNDAKIYRIATGFKCANSACSKKFSVVRGTIFEESKVPLTKWFIAIYFVTAHKKGYSSHQLAKDIAVTQKSAWHMLHRIRYALKEKSFDAPLAGTIELDETYVGGKEKNKHKSKRTEGTQGRSTKVKTPVFGMVERNGRIVAMSVKATDAKTLEPIITEHVTLGSKIMTDEWTAYVRLHRLYDHQIVRHGQGEYVSGDAHTNTMEGFWSLLKRGIVGIYHHVSVKHLDKYVDEFSYRYNSRKIKDGDRFEDMFKRVEGRLMYRTLIKKD